MWTAVAIGTGVLAFIASLGYLVARSSRMERLAWRSAAKELGLEFEDDGTSHSYVVSG